MLGRRRTRIAYLVLCALAPVAAHAQIAIGGIGTRGGIGAGIGGIGARGGRRSGIPSIRDARDAPVINTVDLILRHFHDLALTDTQVTQLTVVKARQDSLIAPIRARLDSIAQAPGRDGDTIIDAGDGDRLLARRDALKAYREVFKKSRGEAFALLEKKQRKRASKLEDDLRKELLQAGRGRALVDPFGDRGGAR
jgi:hypothetical protein